MAAAVATDAVSVRWKGELAASVPAVEEDARVVVLLNDWRAIPREGTLRKTVRASILTVIGTLRTIG